MPVPVQSLTDATTVSIGGYHAIVTTTNNTVRTWGASDLSELGVDEINRIAPAIVYGFDNTATVDVSTGTSHTLVAKTDGSVWAWGINSSYQLGDNTSIQRNIPVRVLDYNGYPNYISGVSKVAASSVHSVAIKSSDGSVWSWGANTNGRLGNNSVTSSNLPVQATFGGNSYLLGITQIAAGKDNTYALKGNTDGSVWAWGLNATNQIGDGTTVQEQIPVQVKTSASTYLTGITAIASGSGAGHALALKSDGTVWAWGLGTSGQIGDGYLLSRAYATQVAGLSNVIAIDAGSAYSLAVKSDGTVWAWGVNSSYQLGQGDTVTRLQPTQVIGISNAVDVSAGGITAFAIKNDGTVWGWGALVNNYGYVGDGTSGVIRPYPVQLPGILHAVEVSASEIHSAVRMNCSY